MTVDRGLLVQPQWLELILSGEKMWELRPHNCRLRERTCLKKRPRAIMTFRHGV